MTQHDLAPCDAPLAQLGEALATLRLRDASALEATRRSLLEHGQLTPVFAFLHDGELQLLDGFKRLAAARKLGWATLRVHLFDLDLAAATLRILQLHQGLALTDLEQGWIVSALHRQHNLSFGEIASLLGRDKTWVWRHCTLVEALGPELQADVRLGLLSPRAAICLASLPRGNEQTSASRIVTARGLTVRQTQLLVGELREAPAEQRAGLLERWSKGPPLRGANGSRKAHIDRGTADPLVVTISALRRAAVTLHAQLCARPLQSMAPDAAQLVRDGLLELRPVLDALRQQLQHLEHTDPLKDVA